MSLIINFRVSIYMAVLHREEHANTFVQTFQVLHVLGNVTSVELLDMLMHHLAKNGAEAENMRQQVLRRAVEIVRIIKKELTVLDARVIYIISLLRSSITTSVFIYLC